MPFRASRSTLLNTAQETEAQKKGAQLIFQVNPPLAPTFSNEATLILFVDVNFAEEEGKQRHATEKLVAPAEEGSRKYSAVLYIVYHKGGGREEE